MKTYMFYASEEKTSKNIQFLGIANGKNYQSAKKTLLNENLWILESDFKKNHIVGKQLVDDNLKNAIKKVVDYLWNDEEKHYEENPETNHIFLILKELKNIIN